MKVVWTQSAKSDLIDIVEYIKLDSLENAKSIFQQIKDFGNDLISSPEKGRFVPELQDLGIVKYRELIFKRWRMIYKIAENKISILMIVDSSRNLEDLLFKRLIT
ncbi:MAG: type II toxin-antitoxin system RelE/ParE family toxin [Campylobacterales bacterium]|nr:type II toxin-antitoxin system RelE/ParE family toxin [Campylobacterales bacterium]